MLELPSGLGLRRHRLEASYTAARLSASDETRSLARDFEEAADKFRLLEEEEARLELKEVEVTASVEAADDAWDDVMLSFRRRLLELSNNDVDHDLYRRHFADIPSHVTELSYAAEILISKDLERELRDEEEPELQAFSQRLEHKRMALEAILLEQTRLEVDVARFQNRVSLAKSILNKLRRILFASLEELALRRGYGRDWCARFYLHHERILSTLHEEGGETMELPAETGSVLAAQLTDGSDEG